MNDSRTNDEDAEGAAFPPRAHGAARGEGETESAAMPGLCRHCDNNGHCTLGTREGPVWHCEHYQ